MREQRSNREEKIHLSGRGKGGKHRNLGLMILLDAREDKGDTWGGLGGGGLKGKERASVGEKT